MGYGDYDWGLYRDYCRDPFPQSLLRTKQSFHDDSKPLAPNPKLSALNATSCCCRHHGHHRDDHHLKKTHAERVQK